jgi:hypothetical protein
MYTSGAMLIWSTQENGQKILVTQAPDYPYDTFKSIVEVVISIPDEILHLEH